MSEKCSTFVSKMRSAAGHILQRACRVVCVLGLLCIMMCAFNSCHWHEAKQVIITADSLDQSEHVVYDDTAALSRTIRCLDNPFGRLIMRSTLGKAYYYMGRNYSLSDQIIDAADCYINADRLQIDDPIYRGRVNTNMGYICAQNNNDSLALIFYERASENFKESENEWRYAQMLLDRSELNINLHNYFMADSLIQVAQTFSLDSAYQARYYETRGLYHYEQQQYDSALVQFQRGLDYWQSEEGKCFSYLKMLQIYLDMNAFNSALPFAQCIVEESNNPNYLINAYYCLMQDAKRKNNTELLSQYSHARSDAQRQLRNNTNKTSKVIPTFEEYLSNPHPWRWAIIVMSSIAILCVFLIIGIIIYHKYATTRIHMSDEQIVSLSAQVQKQQDELQKQSRLHRHDMRLISTRRKFPKPLNRWNDYSRLKQDVKPYLQNWLSKLESLGLTDREKVFCVLSFIYPQMAAEDFASFLCITKEALIVRKNRIAKKLGLTSMELGRFLQNLANNE